MDENKYAFLCTVTLSFSGCQNHLQFNRLTGIYETLPFKNCATLWYRAWRVLKLSSAHGEAKFCGKKKYYTHWQQTKTNMHSLMHNDGFLAVKITEISIFHLFNGIYENLPFKIYATLWCRAWRISWDMSSAHGEVKFCKKKIKNKQKINKTKLKQRQIYIFMHSKQLFGCQNHWNFNFSFFTAPLKIVVISRMTDYKLRCVVCTCRNKILLGEK